jgi:hypothetical protein
MHRRAIHLKINDLALARSDGAWAGIIGIGSDHIHEIIVMRRIVMKEAELFCAGFLGQADTARPRGMPPAVARSDFLLSKC